MRRPLPSGLLRFLSLRIVLDVWALSDRAPFRSRCLETYLRALRTVGPTSGAPAVGSEALFQRQGEECAVLGHIYITVRLDFDAYTARAKASRLSERAAWAVWQLHDRLVRGMSATERLGIASGFGMCVPEACARDPCSLASVVAHFLGLAFGLGTESGSLPPPQWCHEANATLAASDSATSGTQVRLFDSALLCEEGLRLDCAEEVAAAAVLAPAADRAWEGGLLGQRTRFCTAQLSVMCDLRQESETVKPQQSLAVLIVGVRERYYMTATLRHVVRRAVLDGYQVDYYVILSWQPSHTSGTPLWSKDWPQPLANPATVNLTVGALRERIVREARHYGARQAHLLLLEDVAEPLPRRQRLLGYRSEDSPPLVNALKRYQMTETLWNYVAALSRPASVAEYTHVMLTRDDIFWVDDVHMVHFPDPEVVYSGSLFGLCHPTPAPPVPNERALVMSGAAAERLLRLSSEYMTNPSPKLDGASSVETFLLELSRLKGLSWKVVRQDWLPFFLAMHVRRDGSEPPVLCFRVANRHMLLHPETYCVHPDLVHHPFCEDM